MTDLAQRLTAVGLTPETIERRDGLTIAYLMPNSLPGTQATVTRWLEKAGLLLRNYGIDGVREYVAFEESGVSDLTLFEQEELEQCEMVIENGWRTYVAVGSALKAIRDKRLYRQQYGTWEAYIADRWSHLFSDDSTANRWINAADVQIAITPIGVEINESQARELSGLMPDIQRGIVTIALEVQAMEGAKKLTASHIRHTVQEIIDTDPADFADGDAVKVIAANVVERRQQSKSAYIERTQGDKPSYQDLLDALRKIIDSYEWVSCDDTEYCWCGFCGAKASSSALIQHDADCPIGHALKLVGESNAR